MNLSPSSHISVSDFAYQHRYIILVIVLIDSIMASLDSSMVNIALPTITTVFHSTLADSQWVVTAYLITMTSLFIICGKLSEFLGVCKLFTIGSVVFTLSSLCCGLSEDLNQLILFRIVQGLGSSMVAGISSVIIFRVFPSGEIGRALGFSGSIFSIFSLVGPAFGGIINDVLGWKYIFFVNVPIGIVLFIANLKFLKIPEKITQDPYFDWIGAVSLSSLIILFFVIFGAVQSGTHDSYFIFLSIGSFLLSIAIFLFHESRCKKPLIDLMIFKNGRYMVPVVSSLLLGISNFSLITLIPFYFEGVTGMNSFEIGIILMITPIVQIFASSTTGWIIDRYNWRYLAGSGLLIVSLTSLCTGYAFVAINIGLILILMVFRSIGVSFFQSQKSIDVMNALPKEQMALASSVSTTAGCLGSACGVTLAAMLMTGVLHSAGYFGPILQANLGLLTWASAVVVIITGVLCIPGACASYILKRRPVYEEKVPYQDNGS
ncbi:MFS transporter [Methanospirillum lacunae]|uniref:MFS transporter n=1 Tax=Methanospirillum lacunae TaxID=668570 RepID=A0A2V2N0W2_9EURY|nr:MFS transporter [Methanospirillum lacunae]PWR71286.1 MFS transporter [Methanospirillum lacunae]